MGVQRKRRRREERLEEEEQEQGREPAEENVLEKERPQEREPTAVDRVIDLQKTAGNRATTAALSRWGIGTLPLAAAPQWPKEPQAIVDGEVIPLKSWGWSDQSPTSGAGSVGAGKVELNDVNVQAVLGDHSSDLARKSARGEPVKTVVIVVPGKDGKGITLTFHDVLITSYSVSGNQESWSMNFRSKEFSQSPPQAQPRP
jgi:Type VI secretion system effector, Hcp